MTIEEIRKAKRQLEADLEGMIAARVKTFNEDTSVIVGSVDVRMCRTCSSGIIYDSFVTGVSVSLETGL